MLQSGISSSQPSETQKHDYIPYFSQPNEALFYEPLSQDIDAYLRYQNTYLNPVQNVPTQEPPKKTDRKKRNLKKKSNNTNQILCSHVGKKVKKGKRIINISIQNMEENTKPDDVCVQYIVEDEQDELLNAAEVLVKRISQKLNDEIIADK